MVNTETIRTIVGIIGNVISFCLFASPCPTFCRIWKKKDVEEFSPYPYIATVMNCLLWVFYGLPFVHPDITLVLTINSIGLAVELGYLAVFLLYGNNGHRKKIEKWFAAELIAVGGLAVITLTLSHTYVARSRIVGICCVVSGTIMYASPLTVMRDVIRTKSVEYMPFWLSAAAFSNGVIWLIYSLLKFDLFILISSGVGALLGVVQLVLYAIIYYRTTPKNDDAKPSEVQLQSPV